MFKLAISKKFTFSLLVILQIIFYAITYFYSNPFGVTVMFSAIWTLGYFFAIRRFLTKPIDDFAAKHISYASPNMYWVNFAKGLVKNNIRFIFVSSCHLFMALLPTFIYRIFLDKPHIIVIIFISNAGLPITYLYIFKKLYLRWMQKNK